MEYRGDMGDAEDRLDAATLDLVAAAYRGIHDSDGFDDLLERWDRLSPARQRSAARGFSLQSEGLKSAVDNAPEPENAAGAFFAINHATGPAFVMSNDRAIVAANTSGSRVFGALVGGHFDTDLLREEARAEFARLVAACRDGLREYHCLLPVTLPGGRSAVAAGYLTQSELGRETLIVMRAIGIGWDDRVSTLLQSQFALSEAETLIARALFETADVARISRERGTSIRTVRTQLREIYAKTGTSGQVELVRLISSLCARQPGEGGAPSQWQDPLGRERQFEVPGRGTVAYSWMGREGGRPALLIHGPFTGYILREEIQAQLEADNIQLFAIHRPGFGNSRFTTGGDAVADASAAIVALLDHLELGSVPFVSLVSGLVPALQAAVDHPDRVRSMLNLGGCVSAHTPELRAHMPQRQRMLLSLATNNPVLCDIAGRIGARAVRSKGPEFMLSRLYQHSPRDLAAISDPRVFSLLMATVLMLTAQDHRAFVRDLRLIAYPIDDLLGQIQCNLHLLAGEDDPVFPVEQVEAMAALHPLISVARVGEAGQALVHSHPERCAEAMAEFFRLA